MQGPPDAIMVVYSLDCEMSITAKYDVFLDGSCTFCQWTRSKIEPYDSHARLQFLDYNDPKVSALTPFPRSDLDFEMHVRTPEGVWLKGFDAWRALLTVLPKLSWLGRIAGLPPLRWIGPSFYAFVARHRYSLPGAPPRREEDACAIPAHRLK
jgi:predicted DCC family thiol-disulfide oxidoreductase YuxK